MKYYSRSMERNALEGMQESGGTAYCDRGKTTELGILRLNNDIPGYPVCTTVARAQLIGQRRFLPWFGPKRPIPSCVILFSELYPAG